MAGLLVKNSKQIEISQNSSLTRSTSSEAVKHISDLRAIRLRCKSARYILAIMASNTETQAQTLL